MTTFERQQKILRLLSEKPGIKTVEMVDLLGVSRGTIRNDLLTLEEQKRIRRVRGGAVLTAESQELLSDQSSINQVIDNLDQKRRIARWASELVEDGDVILMGAGTTVNQMVSYLIDRRDLTIVTNGLKTARLLKQKTDHTVIVLGGVLIGNGDATGGLLNIDVLQHLNIHTAFLSGSGFTSEARITERTLDEAELKRAVLGKSLQTAILMDSTKLGKVGRFPFADLADITHFYTDSEVSSELMEQMRASKINLMVCGENTFRSYMVSELDSRYILGFANQSEALPFAVDVRRGLERAIKDLKNINLVIADNKLSAEEALRVADKLIERNVDLAIEYQIDHKAGSLIMDKFQQANIPVIAIDIPMVGATFFGIDNYRAGHIAGVAMGQWLQENWNGAFSKMLVLEEPRAGELPAARIQGQIDGVVEVIGDIPEDKLVFLDSGNTRSISEANVTKAMLNLPHCSQIAVLSFNTDAATGALQAAKRLDREQDIIIVGQGADRLLLDEIRQPGSRIIGSTSYMPGRYGEQLLKLALRILKGEPVPPAVYTDHVFLDAQNIDSYYPSA